MRYIINLVTCKKKNCYMQGAELGKKSGLSWVASSVRGEYIQMCISWSCIRTFHIGFRAPLLSSFRLSIQSLILLTNLSSGSVIFKVLSWQCRVWLKKTYDVVSSLQFVNGKGRGRGEGVMERQHAVVERSIINFTQVISSSINSTRWINPTLIMQVS